MTTIETPYRIKLLIHFAGSPERSPYWGTKAYNDEVDSLLKDGAIKAYNEPGYNGDYCATPLGQAWVQALCNVQIPKMVFVDQLGNVLE